ncbi:hypothetical protein [Rossellomorea aquimaris]|uniref:Uncharacterized protein n=1 Tax=Rossellomorea aquimaris TaxID=189382 RepID=A0A5D4TKQ7_9BACI|nr:hypothetical protein [Rossellomorea aquimaris]TYS75539.1 hypothetical protein FZC80_17270 [Rossellomorea aquimaris]
MHGFRRLRNTAGASKRNEINNSISSKLLEEGVQMMHQLAEKLQPFIEGNSLIKIVEDEFSYNIVVVESGEVYGFVHIEEGRLLGFQKWRVRR